MEFVIPPGVHDKRQTLAPIHPMHRRHETVDLLLRDLQEHRVGLWLLKERGCIEQNVPVTPQLPNLLESADQIAEQPLGLFGIRLLCF
ncbi:MAG: hypothetical protein IPO56_07440 [Flavobacteriales bacterium]|nr:hypothetical protein [Flavobacteriales bacterium]